MIPLQRVLHTIVGITRTQYIDVAADVYEDFMEFENMQWDISKKWISAARNSNLNRRGFSVLSANKKSIQASSLWVNYSLHTRRVNVKSDFDETYFTTIKITEMVDEACIH